VAAELLGQGPPHVEQVRPRLHQAPKLHTRPSKKKKKTSQQTNTKTHKLRGSAAEERCYEKWHATPSALGSGDAIAWREPLQGKTLLALQTWRRWGIPRGQKVLGCRGGGIPRGCREGVNPGDGGWGRTCKGFQVVHPVWGILRRFTSCETRHQSRNAADQLPPHSCAQYSVNSSHSQKPPSVTYRNSLATFNVSWLPLICTTHTQAHTQTQNHTHTHTQRQTHAHTHTQRQTHTHTHTQRQTHAQRQTQTQNHTHTHTQTQSQRQRHPEKGRPTDSGNCAWNDRTFPPAFVTGLRVRILKCFKKGSFHSSLPVARCVVRADPAPGACIAPTWNTLPPASLACRSRCLNNDSMAISSSPLSKMSPTWHHQLHRSTVQVGNAERSEQAGDTEHGLGLERNSLEAQLLAKGDGGQRHTVEPPVQVTSSSYASPLLALVLITPPSCSDAFATWKSPCRSPTAGSQGTDRECIWLWAPFRKPGEQEENGLPLGPELEAMEQMENGFGLSTGPRGLLPETVRPFHRAPSGRMGATLAPIQVLKGLGLLAMIRWSGA